MSSEDRSSVSQQAEPDPRASLARLAIEAGPLLIFFVTNNLYGLMVGTGCFMVATLASLLISLKVEKRLPIMPLVGCLFVLAFGGLTLALDDELFIKIKPTVVNLLFAAALIGGQLAGRNFLNLITGGMLHLTERGWQVLTWRWAAFFVVLAVLNEIVWRTVSTDTWVSFKVFGILPLTLVFAAAQTPLILRHQPPSPGSDSAPR